MAIITIEKESENFVHFRLGNKPEYLAVIDREDFEKFVDGQTHWYIKLDSRGYSPYIARGIKGYTEKGNKTVRTYFLHWDVCGKICTRATKLVCDHINRFTLDNTKLNLRVTTVLVNVLNTERCENSLSTKYNLPLDYTLGYVKKRNYYQCYYKKTKYVASAKDIDTVLLRINKFIEKQNEVIHGQ